MDVIVSYRRIGDVLMDKGLITKADLRAALAEQKREGGLLGRHLILSGAVSRLELYEALADAWQLPFVKLQDEHVDKTLYEGKDPSLWIDKGWVPWKVSANVLTVATSVLLTEDVIDDIEREFPGYQFSFVVTTDWDLTQTISSACRDALSAVASQELARVRPELSAASGLTRWQRWSSLSVVLLLLAVFIYNFRTGVIVLLAAANLTFLASVLFKTFAGVRWPFRKAKMDIFSANVAEERVKRGLAPVWNGLATSEDDLPIYTILVPAYKEVDVISKVVSHMNELDYPKSKLDVLILLEEDDVETIEAVKNATPAEYVRIVVVPAGVPQTKPRACNYGLMFARGEFVVIYDAEDRPDANQLRAAVTEFNRDDFERELLGHNAHPLVCTQASLNYFNADYNVLTRMFSIEYAHWFDAMLPGLDGTGVPLPLGGTSNHFRTSGLQKLGGWDPYNVTEDADLGLRASAEGYRVSTIRSTTWEEACSQTRAWIRQRTRWIKGYMVTAAVNFRHPVKLWRQTGWPGMVGLFGLILATPVSFLLYPVTLFMTLATYLGTQVVELGIPSWLITAAVANMVFGNVMMVSSAMVASWSRYGWRVSLFSVFLPVYWCLHSFAAWRAAWQMVFDPFKWEKTPHGLTGDYETATKGPT